MPTNEPIDMEQYGSPDGLHKRFAAMLSNVPRLLRDQTAELNSYSYSYTNINQVLAVLKPILAEHNFAVAQPITTTTEGATPLMHVNVLVICTVTGRTLSFPGPSFQIKGDPQAAGSAITYFRRYSLVSLFGMEQADDDGGAAHRSAADPTGRTPAEREIRQLIAAMPDGERTLLIADFRDEFGSSLVDLPESRHGDALTWVKSQLRDAEGSE